MSKSNKKKKKNIEQISEDELAEMFGYAFIAGFTSGGMPYGITLVEAEEQRLLEEKEQSENSHFSKNEDIEDSDLPF